MKVTPVRPASCVSPSGMPVCTPLAGFLPMEPARAKIWTEWASVKQGQSLWGFLLGPGRACLGRPDTRGTSLLIALDTKVYEKGIKISNAQMKRLDIRGDAFHPGWNYAVIPRLPKS